MKIGFRSVGLAVVVDAFSFQCTSCNGDLSCMTLCTPLTHKISTVSMRAHRSVTEFSLHFIMHSDIQLYKKSISLLAIHIFSIKILAFPYQYVVFYIE